MKTSAYYFKFVAQNQASDNVKKSPSDSNVFLATHQYRLKENNSARYK